MHTSGVYARVGFENSLVLKHAIIVCCLCEGVTTIPAENMAFIAALWPPPNTLLAHAFVPVMTCNVLRYTRRSIRLSITIIPATST